MATIGKLDCSPEFNVLNFKAVEYLDAKGERRRSFDITRDGFSFLVMGFTGARAAVSCSASFMAAIVLDHRPPRRLPADDAATLSAMAFVLANLPGEALGRGLIEVQDRSGKQEP